MKLLSVSPPERRTAKAIWRLKGCRVPRSTTDCRSSACQSPHALTLRCNTILRHCTICWRHCKKAPILRGAGLWRPPRRPP